MMLLSYYVKTKFPSSDSSETELYITRQRFLILVLIRIDLTIFMAYLRDEINYCSVGTDKFWSLFYGRSWW